MINMIKADFYRVFKGNAIYIAIFLMLAMIAMSIYNVSGGSVGQASVGGISTTEYDLNVDNLEGYDYEEIQKMSMSEYRKVMLMAKNYKLDKSILASNMNLYYIFIFVAALAITADFSTGSIKNTLSSAISRRKYYVSKIIFVNLVCIILFFCNTYLAYFANIMFNSKNLASGIGEVTKITMMQIPEVLALVSLLVGIAFLTKRTAIYNMISLPFIIVFQLILGLIVHIFHIKETYIYYELQLMFGKLAGKPSGRYVLYAYLLCAVILLFCYLCGWLSFRKTEVK